MKGRILNIVLVLVLATLPMAANAGWSEAQQVTHQTLPAPAMVEQTPTPDVDFNSSPVMFIENVGQWDDGARFQVWGGPAGTMWLAEDAIWITVIETRETGRQVDKALDPEAMWSFEDQEQPEPRRGVNIKLSFVGANPHPRIETFDRLDTTVSYFYGNDPKQWRPEVPVWGGVRYVDLYPGIDLELTSEGRWLVQRFASQPGATLDVVRMHVEGTDAVSLDRDALRLSAAAGEFTWPLQRAIGTGAGDLVVESSDVLAFDLAAPFVSANTNRQWKVEVPNSPADNPADLLYSTFLGGSASNQGHAIVTDGAGNAYVTGETRSTNFPATLGAFDTSHNGNTDAFVAKFSPAGNALVYATFVGGGGGDSGGGIAVDGAGSATMRGTTYSADFPTTPGSFDTSYNGGILFGGDAFVARLNPAGSALIYATFLGGSASDSGRAIAVDNRGSALVTGYTGSIDFPTTPGAFNTSHNGYTDTFVVRLALGLQSRRAYLPVIFCQ